MVFVGGPGLLATSPGDTTSGVGIRAYSVASTPTGCGPEAGADTEDPFYACPAWATPLDGTGTTSPVLDDATGVAYVGTDAGTLWAIDAATGAVLWTSSVGAAVTADPSLAYSTLFVPTASGRLAALPAGGCGAPTCAPAWTAETGSSIDVQAAVAGGVVFTGSADGTVRAFDAAGCGAAVCTATWSGATGSAITGAPAVSNGRLFVGTADGRLIAYQPTS
jgi:outer membrane protein assembly factor BamB